MSKKYDWPVLIAAQVESGLTQAEFCLLERSQFDPALFVFCNQRRNQLKVLYWDATGFALWQKRLERDTFKWPRRHADDVLVLDHEQWSWLLRGFDIAQIKPHKALFFDAAS
ncbi:MAG: IS66 family insertion sequence element accessory protein TnpB [Alcanivoracaceae bacterium]